MIQGFYRVTCDNIKCNKSVDMMADSSLVSEILEIQFNSKFAGHPPGKIFTFCNGVCLAHALSDPTDRLNGTVKKP